MFEKYLLANPGFDPRTYSSLHNGIPLIQAAGLQLYLNKNETFCLDRNFTLIRVLYYTINLRNYTNLQSILYIDLFYA